MHDDELRPHETRAFESLARESDPGRVLEERTVRALAARGLLQQRRARVFAPPWVWSAVGIAALALFATGFVLGRSAGGDNAAASRRTIRESVHDIGDGSTNRTVAVTTETGDSTDSGSVRYVVWF